MVSVGLLAAMIAGGGVPAMAAEAADPAPADPTTTAGASPILVAYGFDQDVATGPDTLRVFENARGSVGISELFAWSGYRAVELRDRAGDGDFPELQGFFPLTRQGRLLLRFALLVTDPGEEANVALAGPAGFTLGRDGIAVWLATRDGWLWHTSDSIPRRLLALEPFVWYLVEVRYDVGRGRYDLVVGQAGANEAAVVRHDQANAASMARSAVNLFSFIGDNGDDLSQVVYYVDDVLVARDEEALPAAFVAPGRRRYFVDLLLAGDPGATSGGVGALARCPTLTSLNEVGLDPAALANLDPASRRQLLALLDFGAAELPSGAAEAPQERSPDAATGSQGEPPRTPLAPALERLTALRRGCAALAAGRFAAAQELLAAAPEPRGLALELAEALALAALGDPQAEATLAALLTSSETRHDPRVERLAAAIAARGGDPLAALAWITPRVATLLAASSSNRPAAERAELQPAAPEPSASEQAAAERTESESPQAEQPAGTPTEAATLLLAAFHLHLAADDLAGAGALADQIARHPIATVAGGAGAWFERAGHAAFLARDLPAARSAYERARRAGGDPTRLDLALADVAHLAGDTARERELREGIYGRLAD